MPKYSKTNWINGETILKAEHMQKIEQGIVDLYNEIENITLEATDLSNYYTKSQTDNKISEEIAKAQLGGSGEVDLSTYATKNYVDDEISKIELKEGPQGPKGDKGDTGEQGPKGDTGPAGTTDYNSLLNKPTIPTKTSQLTNDSNFVTASTLDTRMNNKNIWCGTKSQYEAITTKDNNTLYFVLGE